MSQFDLAVGLRPPQNEPQIEDNLKSAIAHMTPPLSTPGEARSGDVLIEELPPLEDPFAFHLIDGNRKGAGNGQGITGYERVQSSPLNHNAGQELADPVRHFAFDPRTEDGWLGDNGYFPPLRGCRPWCRSSPIMVSWNSGRVRTRA